MKRINAEVIAGTFILIFALTFLSAAREYAYYSPSGPGPGFFGVWLSSILAVLAAIYIFKSLKAVDAIKSIIPKGEALKSMLMIIGSLVGFIILLPILGFVITSIIFLLFLFKSNYNWKYSAAISVGVSAFLFWLFQIVLNIQLPTLMVG